MLRAVSTYLYVKERLHPGILDGLTRNGAQAIEIFRRAATLRLREPQSASERRLPNGSAEAACR